MLSIASSVAKNKYICIHIKTLETELCGIAFGAYKLEIIQYHNS